MVKRVKEITEKVKDALKVYDRHKLNRVEIYKNEVVVYIDFMSIADDSYIYTSETLIRNQKVLTRFLKELKGEL